MTADTKNENGAHSQSSYRPEIDGLRALAVVAVIVNHFSDDLLPSGYLGVDIFFVISGFVITSSLADRPSKNFGDFLLGFYSRRIKRLVPALVLFVVITSVLMCLFNPSPKASLWTGITSLFGLSNLYLLKQSTDYFADSTKLNIFAHTWSLGVEEQFYFFFPVLVWLTGFGRMTAKGARNLFWVTAALSFVSLMAFVFLYRIRQPAAYFLIPTRLWELGVGCLLFLGLKHTNWGLRALQTIPPLIVTAAIIGTMFFPLQFAVQTTVAVVALTAFLIASLRSGTAAYILFTRPPVVYIGLVSYSLYLWHWGVLCLSRWTIGIHWWSVPLQVALMLLLSIASYRFVETPLRRAEWSAVRWQSIGYGIGTSASAAGLLAVFSMTPGLSLYTGRKLSMVSVGVRSLTEPYSLKPVNSQWGGEKCVLSDNDQVGKEIPIEDCTLGNFSSSKKRVIVIGNSYSAAFTQAFDDLVVSDGYSVTITSCWGASPVKEIPRNGGPWDKANIYYWDNVVPSLVNRLRPGDWVFLINDMAEFSPKTKSSESTMSLHQLERGLDKLSGGLSEKGIRLAILHGNPFAREANCRPESAAQWFTPFGGPCKLPNRSQSLLRREDLNRILTSMEAQGKIRIVDLFDVFCPEERCTYTARNGQLLYRDEFSHPSVEGVRLSSPLIRKVLTSSDHLYKLPNGSPIQ